MDEVMAREILGDWIKPDGGLYALGVYIAWPSAIGAAERACLDGHFTHEELEAVAWWMRNKVVR